MIKKGASSSLFLFLSKNLFILSDMPLFDYPDIQNITGSINVTGSVRIENYEDFNVSVSASFGTGSLSIDNFPTVQTITGAVKIDEQPIDIAGSVTIDNFPIIQTITGSVIIGEQPININGSTVSVDNFPATQTITGSVVLGEQPIQTTGSVTINNFPSVQTITGSVVLGEQPINVDGSTVSIDNFPAVQQITGSIILGEQPIQTTGSVTVNNFPAVQTITGSVVLGEQPINITGSTTVNSIVAPIKQGIAGTQDEGWFVKITDGTQQIGNTPATPLWISGAVSLNEEPIQITGSVILGEQPILITGSINLDEPIPAGDNRIGRFSLVSGSNSTQEVSVIKDTGDNIIRLATVGKVSISPPAPPSDTNSVTIAADTPIVVNNSLDTDYTIGSGKVFIIQQIVCGAEGDPNEKGSKVEVYYVSASTEYLIERVYITGTTQYGIYPDTSQTRGGLFLSGSGTEQIRIRRKRLGGSGLEIDAVVRGYEK